jgi:hypothetical protein
MHSYSQDVFKVSVANEHFVLKVNNKSSSHVLQKEFGVIALLDMIPQSIFSLPTSLCYYECPEMEIMLSVWLGESKMLSEFEIDNALLDRIASAISLIQKSLGVYLPSGTNVNRVIEVCNKITKFSRNFIGLNLDLTTEILGSNIIIPGIEKTGSFSDRSTENWLYTREQNLYAIDFGLITNGHPVEDWINFIDSMGFTTTTDVRRDRLYEVFCSKLDGLNLSYEHCELVSLYRNVMQACLYYPLNKEKSKWHFEKGARSADRLSLYSVVRKIDNIKNRGFEF